MLKYCLLYTFFKITSYIFGTKQLLIFISFKWKTVHLLWNNVVFSDERFYCKSLTIKTSTVFVCWHSLNRYYRHFFKCWYSLKTPVKQINYSNKSRKLLTRYNDVFLATYFTVLITFYNIKVTSYVCAWLQRCLYFCFYTCFIHSWYIILCIMTVQVQWRNIIPYSGALKQLEIRFWRKW